MKCDMARRLLNPLIEGELDGNQRGEIRDHLADCPVCRSELNGLRGAVRLLETMPAVSVPSGLAPAVMARVLRQSHVIAPSGSSPFAWIVAAFLAGLGALVLYGYLGEVGLPWDPSVLAAAEPLGLDSLASLLVSLEVGVLIGASLLFAGMAGLLLSLMGREQRHLHG